MFIFNDKEIETVEELETEIAGLPKTKQKELRDIFAQSKE